MNIEKLNFVKKIIKIQKTIRYGYFLLFSLTLLLTGCESFNDKIHSLNNRVQQTFKTPCDRNSAEKLLAQEYETNEFFAYYRKFKLKYNIKSTRNNDTRNGYSYCTVALDYSSNQAVAKMIKSILDHKLSLIEFDEGMILEYKEDALGKVYLNSDKSISFARFSEHLDMLDKKLKIQNCDLAYRFKLVGVDIREINEKYGYENKCANYE